jgi:hypothetical protein
MTSWYESAPIRFFRGRRTHEHQERAYKLMTEQYGLMTASFLRVLILQRMLYENETAYVDALERTWTSSIALRGFLLEGALRSSANSRRTNSSPNGNEEWESMGEGTRMFDSPSGLTPR